MQEITAELINDTIAFIKQKMNGEQTGHDWYHIERVWKMSKKIQKTEGGDLPLIELAALLHDLGDYKFYGNNEKKGSLALKGMMDIIGIDEELQNTIAKIIDSSQFIGDATKKPETLEGQILQDADFLDSLGALGIARVFATGGAIRRVIHDPEIPVRQKISKFDYFYKKINGTSRNYFTEKILKLPKLLNTKTAKVIAEKRIKFVVEFLAEFDLEWNLVK